MDNQSSVVLPSFSNHHNLLNKSGLFELILHHLWNNVLPTRCFKYFFFTVCNFQELSVDHFTNISCMEPSIFSKYLFCFFWLIVIPHHYIRTTYNNFSIVRSEERRVGKECRSRWWQHQ